MAYQEGKKSGGGFESSERIDPVCGMTVKKDSPHKLEHEGKEYFSAAGSAGTSSARSR
jgi:hypothetical protein